MNGPRRPTSLWKPGQSGNPGGLTREMREEIKLLREVCKAKTPRMIQICEHLAEHAKDEGVRLRAAEAIMNRAGFKEPKLAPDDKPIDPVAEAIEVDPEITALSDEELTARVRALRAAEGAGAGRALPDRYEDS